jgi:hypothetical protein
MALSIIWRPFQKLDARNDEGSNQQHKAILAAVRPSPSALRYGLGLE